MIIRSVLDVAVNADLSCPDPGHRTRNYRILITTFRIRFDSEKVEAAIHSALVHLEVELSREIDKVLDIRCHEDEYVVLDGIVPLKSCSDLARLTPMVKNIVRQTAIDNYTFFTQVHAGVISFNGNCALLCGAPGSGKTTLTSGLLLDGCGYLSDEVALLEINSLRVQPFPLALSIKSGTAEILRSLWPAIEEQPVHLREDDVPVRYVPPPVPFPEPTEDGFPVRWLIFPKYRADADTVLHPIPKADALQRIMSEFMVFPGLLDKQNTRAMVHWIRSVECFELDMSSLAEATSLVKDLCRG